MQQRILQAATQARRSVLVKLLAVSKTVSPPRLRAAYAAGQTAFGENYAQEARTKMAALTDCRTKLEWHFIGAIQSNKTAFIAQHFDWVHTVDRLSTAQRLSVQRPDNLPALNICIQVNISREPQKNGIAPEETESLAKAIAALPNLRLRGLMALPKAPIEQPHSFPATVSAAYSLLNTPHNEVETAQRLAYRQMYLLYSKLQHQGLALDTLSMGTSADLEAAVLEGATMIRVGSAIFGERPR